VLPLKDKLPTRSFPAVTVALIGVNVAVWLAYQVPDVDGTIDELGFQPCEVDGSCATTGLTWPANAVTSMFAHGGWDHIAVNMLFLWIFGNNVEDALGRVRYLLFYLSAGFAASALQTWVTLQFGTASEATLPEIGASGAIAGVLGGYLILFPRARILSWVFPVFFLPVRAWLYLGVWFLFQLAVGGYAFTHPVEGGGVAYAAHVGGFALGFLTARAFMAGRPPKLGMEAA